MESRSSWKARPPKYVNKGSMNKPSTGHWNGPTVKVGGKTTWDHSKCASLIRGIQNFHMDSRGWADIAYNFIVCPHRVIFEGRGFNIWNGANGTNTANRTSHAIMWLSGEDNPFTDGEKAAFREAVKLVSDKTLAPDKAVGHRDHKSTACPGDERYRWIQNGMNVPSTVPPSMSPYDVVFEVGSRGPGVGLIQAIANIMHLERIPATGGGHGMILPINDEEPYFGRVTEEAVREIQRFLHVMWELNKKQGDEPRVTGKVDNLTLSGMAFWTHQILNK